MDREHKNRQIDRKQKFDKNRHINMEEELQQRIVELEMVLKQQELKINQQQQQLQQQVQQINLQQQHQQVEQQQQIQIQHQQQQSQHQQQQVQQNQVQGFYLKPEHIIAEFRRIRPLDKDHNLRQFIMSVESTLALAGGNDDLIAYGLRIVTNEKLEGDAGKMVRELTDGATWEQIKNQLLKGLQPRRTYGEIFNFARNAKVSNLSELFDIFTKVKYEINELYELDVRRPSIYNPNCVDRDLVDLMIEKIDGPIRAHIGEDETLSSIMAKYTKLKLLYDTRAIAFGHRTDSKNKDFAKINRQTPKKIGQNFMPHNSGFQNKNNFNYNTPISSDSGFQNRNDINNRVQMGSSHTRNYHNTQQSGFSNQRKNDHNGNCYNSGQQRRGNYCGEGPEPMEIGTLHQESEVNFLIPPQNPTCP